MPPGMIRPLLVPEIDDGGLAPDDVLPHQPPAHQDVILGVAGHDFPLPLIVLPAAWGLI